MNKLKKLLQELQDSILKNSIDSKITIILTTCVNVDLNKNPLYQKKKDERILIYSKAIQKWIDKTNLKIIVIENSGYNFPAFQSKQNHRFEIISFIENETPYYKSLLFKNSKGSSEILSINYAFEMSKLIKSTDFICKVTGRYFITDFEEYLNQINIFKYDCFTQNNINRCEFVGCQYYLFDKIFSLNIDEKFKGHVESDFKYRILKYKNTLKCKEFNIEPTKMGGLNITNITL